MRIKARLICRSHNFNTSICMDCYDLKKYNCMIFKNYYSFQKLIVLVSIYAHGDALRYNTANKRLKNLLYV